MTKAKSAKAKTPDPKQLRVSHPPGQSDERTMAEISLSSVASASSLIQRFGKGTFGELQLTDLFETLAERVAATEAGDLSGQRAMLVTQSLALNAIFAELARRAALNMGDYLDASDRFMRLALKAQAQSRATIEALDRLSNGHVQTVRHVHVDNRGGQAVIAENVNTGGQENEKSGRQPHAIEGCGTAFGQPLRSENESRETVPLARDA